MTTSLLVSSFVFSTFIAELGFCFFNSSKLTFYQTGFCPYCSSDFKGHILAECEIFSLTIWFAVVASIEYFQKINIFFLFHISFPFSLQGRLNHFWNSANTSC